MAKTNFQYDETGNTFYYFLFTFLCIILIPFTYLFWSEKKSDDDEKNKRFLVSNAEETDYWRSLKEKAELLSKKDPWEKTKKRIVRFIILLGWFLAAFIFYQITQIDNEMVGFDPFDILKVDKDASVSEIKKKYRELSLIYHPDKPTGDEAVFMKITKAYKSLTDEEAKLNWERYGNPDGPQAMQLGISLPAWIVEENNSIIVLGIYGFVFMIILPLVVYFWWSNRIKYSNDQVLIDTTKLYYTFLQRTSNIPFKHIIPIISSSFEFFKRFNPEIVERPSDNDEIPKLMLQVSDLTRKKIEKKKRIDFSPPAIKARLLYLAHMKREPLNPNTLLLDKTYIIKRSPRLIQEMVTIISQIMLYSGNPKTKKNLDTLLNIMKLSPCVIQSMTDKSSHFIQLPHVEEEMNRYFRSKNVKRLEDFARLNDKSRRSILRKFSDDQYEDVKRVLSMMPKISVKNKKVYVLDDDDKDQEIITAGALVTVSLEITRQSLLEDYLENDQSKEDIIEDTNECDDKLEESDEENEKKKKTPVWQKNAKKKKTVKKSKKSKSQKKVTKTKTNEKPETEEPTKENDSGNESDVEDCTDDENHEDRKNKTIENDENDDDEVPFDEELEEAEWTKFQKNIKRREKALEVKSHLTHSVHCPYFPQDKQEYWWIFIADKRNSTIVSYPTFLTSLVDNEDIELKFEAPKKGNYTFYVYICSDSYAGVNLIEEIKFKVEEAPQPVEDHAQWNFDDDSKNAEESDDNELATDEESDQSDE